MGRRVFAVILILIVIFFVHIETSYASTVLRQGSRGSEVTRLQQRLIELNFLNTRATGVFGPATRDAVIRFQRAKNLSADGIVGRATLSALFPPSPPRNTTSQAASTVLREGSRGSEVTRLQQRLIELNFLNTRATGVFGPATRDAVVRFQRANNLSADGIVGSTTIAALFPPSPPSNPNINPITSVLRRGSSGSQVRALQNRLIEIGLLNSSATGNFGPLTQTAVESFQRTNNLEVNGIVNSVTAERLFVKSEPTPPIEPQPTPPTDPQSTPPVESQPTPTVQPHTPPSLQLYQGNPGALSGRTIIIDPGHGGSDPGAVRSSVLEKDIVLDISLRLRRILEQSGATVLMTRETDVFRSLLFRSAFANRHVLQREIERLHREGNVTSLQQPSQPGSIGIIGEYEKTMQSLIGLQIEMAQLQQRLSDLKAQIAIIEEIVVVLSKLEQEKEKLTAQEIFQNELKLADLAARIGLPGTTRDVVNSNLQSRQNETNQILLRTNELRRQIEATQRSLEQLAHQVPATTPQAPITTPTLPVHANTDAINMWNAKIAMFDMFINNPNLESRESSIFASSRDASNNVRANDMLTRVFDLTLEKYQNDIIFISIHINSTAQYASDSSGIRIFYRHNGPSFAWGTGIPHYYLNYNDQGRRALAQNLLDSLNITTDFQFEVTSPSRMDFSVLRETNLVSALIEVGFINNTFDRVLLLQEQLRENAASGIYKGILNYFTNR